MVKPLSLKVPRRIIYEGRRFKLSALMEERLVLTVLNCLDANERNILEYRVGFGINEALTYQQIGDMMGTSAEHIRQVEEAALARIVKNCRMAQFGDVKAVGPVTKLEVLDLPPRTHNTLIHAGIIFVEQLTMLTEKDLKTIAGLGRKSMARVHSGLAAKGLALTELPDAKRNWGRRKSKPE